MQDIAKYLPKGAENWPKTWIEEPSLSVFSIDWHQDSSKIIIKQSSFNGSDVLRVHKIKIALFNAAGGITTILSDIIINAAS